MQAIFSTRKRLLFGLLVGHGRWLRRGRHPGLGYDGQYKATPSGFDAMGLLNALMLLVAVARVRAAELRGKTKILQ